MTFTLKSPKDTHKHTYDTVKLIKIMQIDTRPEEFSYHGTPGDKAFLVRLCACEATEYFEYGATSKMKELLEAYG